MLIRVLGFLLEILFFVLIASALLRAYMNWLRINMTAQPGTFVMAVTNWIVKPVRRILPSAVAKSRADSASLLAAVLLALLYSLLWALLTGAFSIDGGGSLLWIGMLVFAVKMVVRVALQTLIILVIGYAILSWVQPGSPVYGLLARLVEPPLAPLRRVVPTIGGVDLSALVLILILQIGLMVLG
jgi:YggT family protein